MADMSAETVASVFLSSWVPRFGVPSQITTDRGRQFESSLFNAFTKLLGTTRLRTTSYHPASNGLVERLHRHLKTALMAREDRDHWVLLGIRAALKPDLGCSSAELVYGSALRLPADFFVPPQHQPAPAEYLQRLQRFFASLRPTPTRTDSSRKVHVPQELATETHVFLRTDAVRRALTPPYSGPHTILSRGEKTFRISIRGKPETVSADRVKPAFVECPTIAASSAPEDASDAPPRTPTPTSPPSTSAPPAPSPKRVHWSDSPCLSLAGGPCGSRRRISCHRYAPRDMRFPGILCQAVQSSGSH
ncbi:uncharacterized protein LOC135382951 [Ornithodoros turicata]|uniref:uncharacterized protein LOC135382951 n=1 Tax=Ornithodoros turicata TaxID=34597 RepID=UPI003139DBCF